MSSITVSITPDAAVTVTVDGQEQTEFITTDRMPDRLTQGGLYRSTTGRTWLYDPQGDEDLPWVRVLDKNSRHDTSLVGKRYADTQDDVEFPVTALTEGATIQR
jgi:hypothetical protein